MRIAFILDEFPALSETFILRQIAGLVDRGHTVEIFADHPRREPKQHSDVARYNLLAHTYYHAAHNRLAAKLAHAAVGAAGLFGTHPRCGFSLACSLRWPAGLSELGVIAYQLRSFIGRGSFDIVHCHYGSNGVLAAFARELGLLSGRLVTTFHGGVDAYSYVNRNGAGIYGQLFAQGELFLPVSRALARRLEGLGCPGERMVVHHNGVSLRDFGFAPRQLPRDGPVRLLSVARLVEMKGLEYAIEAVAQLLPHFPRLHYEIVGDGPLRERLQRQIDRLGVSASVALAGWLNQEELRQRYASAQLFLLPSVTTAGGDQEGQGVVLLEAQAMGLPVVCSHNSAFAETIVEGRSGLMVPERDVAALRAALAGLLAAPERWPAMGEEGRRHIEAHYNIERLNDQLVQHYANLPARPSYAVSSTIGRNPTRQKGITSA